MWTMEYPKENTGCPKCSHRFAEVHTLDEHGHWEGRCPACGITLFGTIFLATAEEATNTVSDEQRSTIQRLSNEGLKAPEIAQKLGLPTQVVAGIIAWQKHPESWGR
jgi:hypothetical protein